MNKIILSAASLILLFACNTNENKTVENLQDSTIVDTPLQEETQSTNVNKSLSTFINGIDLNASADTFYFEEQFEEPIEGQVISINSLLLNNYNIEFSYETSLAITDAQDKSCVLYNGKHSYYPWQNLPITNNSFVMPSVQQNIIPINNYYHKNIVDDIKNNCDGKSFIEALSDSTKIKDVTSVTISKYFLKISNANVTKIISIQAQYGC